MMVLASVAVTSFAILLLFSLPSCLGLRATPYSTEGVGAGASSPYSSDTSPDTDPRSGYCTSTRTFHSIHAPSFSPSSDVLFVFLAFALFFLPNLLPPPMVAAARQPTLVDAGTDAQVFVVSFSDNEQDLEIHVSTTTVCSSLVFLALACIRSFLRPHWYNGLHGV
ncbi:hypothetical protein ZEAMMB73_Zm00001d009875 [Zea mays]|uniref:Uncharacterized protein n=1 Tax=Zea mays TaxID=4577 RepID=A0A1D6FMK9_MAIZE|nr:hypothetical protein ZEAMMB73_Zm00001d009875 [Zea mays]